MMVVVQSLKASGQLLTDLPNFTPRDLAQLSVDKLKVVQQWHPL
jgi:hypothetical protein